MGLSRWCGVRNRGYGKAVVSKDTNTQNVVVMKRIEPTMNLEEAEKEVNTLKDCASEYLVKVIGLQRSENGLQVGLA